MMPMSSLSHRSSHIDCSMDEPIELFVENLVIERCHTDANALKHARGK